MKKFSIKDMKYNPNSPDHRSSLMYVINEISNVERLLKDVERWWNDNRDPKEHVDFKMKKSTISDAKRRTREQEDDSPPRSPGADILYGYFTLSETAPFRVDQLSRKVDQTTTEALVTRAVRDFFHRKSRDYSLLKALEGDYIAYRPCWRSGDPNFLIRSHVSIEPAHGGYWLSEKQDFVADMEWQENDNGVLFHAGKYVVCISADEDSSCFKTYVLTYYEPDSSTKPAKFVRGSVMAVSNHSEKHWAGPFAMIRKEQHLGDFDLKRVSLDELEKRNESGPLLSRALNHIKTWDTQMEEGKAAGVMQILDTSH